MGERKLACWLFCGTLLWNNEVGGSNRNERVEHPWVDGGARLGLVSRGGPPEFPLRRDSSHTRESLARCSAASSTHHATPSIGRLEPAAAAAAAADP